MLRLHGVSYAARRSVCVCVHMNTLFTRVQSGLPAHCICSVDARGSVCGSALHCSSRSSVLLMVCVRGGAVVCFPPAGCCSPLASCHASTAGSEKTVLFLAQAAAVSRLSHTHSQPITWARFTSIIQLESHHSHSHRADLKKTQNHIYIANGSRFWDCEIKFSNQCIIKGF